MHVSIHCTQLATTLLPLPLQPLLLLLPVPPPLLLLPFYQAAMQQRGLADLLVIDPPWENASARRSGRYATLTPNHLLHVPIKQLLKQVRPSPVDWWVCVRCGCVSCACTLPSLHCLLLAHLLLHMPVQQLLKQVQPSHAIVLQQHACCSHLHLSVCRRTV
jgi:hypothetical protein